MKLRNRQITIETTNLCPAHCTICPREKYTQKLEIMDFNLFKKIIDDASQYNITSLDTCGFGEPFTDKLFFERCAYAKQKLSEVEIYASSNCFLMTPDIYHNVIKYVDILKMSIYGVTKDIYEKSHRGCLKFETTISNILGLLEVIKELKSKPYTIGLMTVTDINQHEINDWIPFWESRLDEVFVWKPHNYGGVKEYRIVDHAKQVSCGRPLNGPLYIHVDGTVSMCCFDFNRELIIGDMKTQTIYDILHSDAYKKLKLAHRNRNFKGYICENCCQTNRDPSVLIYATNSNRKVGKLTSNLKDLKSQKI